MYDLYNDPAYEIHLQWMDTDVSYTDQTVGLAERTGGDMQNTRMMASVSIWRDLVFEDLLDKIEEDISQLDYDDLIAI